jgi:hypothetical protein
MVDLGQKKVNFVYLFLFHKSGVVSLERRAVSLPPQNKSLPFFIPQIRGGDPGKASYPNS